MADDSYEAMQWRMAQAELRPAPMTTPNPAGDALKAATIMANAAGEDLSHYGPDDHLRAYWLRQAKRLLAELRTPPPSLDEVKAMVDEEISALEFMRDMKDLTAAGEGELAAFHRVRALLTRLSVSIPQRDDM